MNSAGDQGISLRNGTTQDLIDIAQLHAASWQQTYRGQMPDAYLDGPVIEDRRALWRNRLAIPPQHSILIVAEKGDEFAGFIYLYPDDPGWMMLDNLHIHTDMRGTGVGQRMMRAAAVRLRELGRTKVLLYVLDGNDEACWFYERLGGIPGPVEGHTIAGFENMPSIPYRWHDFSIIAR